MKGVKQKEEYLFLTRAKLSFLPKNHSFYTLYLWCWILS